MFEFLEAFEKRMGFVAVVDSVVNRKNKNSEIEDWFEGEELDNIFFSLLVYIMEQTLTENDECTMENMAAFLADILPAYKKALSYDQVMKLAEYMVKDILQNKGTEKIFGVMDYKKGLVRCRVRLIQDKETQDNRIVYQLTDQGYDFLFRTKEVDRELDFKLEQLKLKELLRRKNYKHALKQSRDLVGMLRQKKREIEAFVDRVRQNIHSIDRGEHEKLLKETYELIDEEYEGMLELKAAVDKDEERINRELEESGFVDKAVGQALENLRVIRRNLQLVISEQRNLMGRRFFMNDVYEEIIKNSFFASMSPRFDFDTELMEPLLAVDENNIGNLWRLFSPLMFANPDKRLNLSLLYDRQGKLKEADTEGELLDEEILEEEGLVERKMLLDAIHAKIVERVFRFARFREGDYRISDLYHHIEQVTKDMSVYTEGKRFFLVMLKLYDYQTIDIDRFRARERDEMPAANGEFDLAYCLSCLERQQPGFYGVKKLVFEKTGETFQAVFSEFTNCEDGITEVVEKSVIMEDIQVRVIFAGEEREVDADAERGAADL